MKYVFSFINFLYALTAILLIGCGKEKIGSIPLQLQGASAKKTEGKENNPNKATPGSQAPKLPQLPNLSQSTPGLADSRVSAKIKIGNTTGKKEEVNEDCDAKHETPDKETPTPEPRNVTVSFLRVCSEWRSSNPKYIFFEEAPEGKILSLELIPVKNPMSSKVLGKAILDKRNLNNVEERIMDFTFDESELVKLSAKEKKESLLILEVCIDRNQNGKCSDESGHDHLEFAKQRLSLDFPYASFRVPVLNGRNKNILRTPGFCEDQISPVVLDLEGNGIELSPVEEGVAFDLANTGENVLSAWTVGQDDAFLVRDLNGNGKIDNGGELFGNATRLSSGKSSAHGFEAMAELDEDGDQYLTAKDKVFGELQLWLDSNSDGLTDSGELRSLSEFHIKSLNLNYLESFEKDEYGNELRQQSSFERLVDGVVRVYNMIDVWFRTLAIY